jgi:hypothetical protein
MRQARMFVSVAAVVCFLLVAGLLVLSWRADAGSNLGELKRMLLQLGE